MTNYQATFSSPDVNTRCSRSSAISRLGVDQPRVDATGGRAIFGGTGKGFYLIAGSYCEGVANVYGIHVGFSGAFSTPCPIPTGGDSQATSR